MTHCEKCIHYDICDSYYGFDDIGTLICRKDCKDFKDKADIQSLQDRIDILNDTNKRLMESQEVYWENKVREFAERLKEAAFIHESPFEANEDKFIKLVTTKDIDNLLKEMVGDK